MSQEISDKMWLRRKHVKENFFPSLFIMDFQNGVKAESKEKNWKKKF